MTRSEYFIKQREITKQAALVEKKTERRIRTAVRKAALPLIRQYMELGSFAFPKEKLAEEIERIIREEGAKPVAETRRLQAELEQSILEKIEKRAVVKLKNLKTLNYSAAIL